MCCRLAAGGSGWLQAGTSTVLYTVELIILHGWSRLLGYVCLCCIQHTGLQPPLSLTPAPHHPARPDAGPDVRFTATVPKMGAYIPDSGTPLAISHRIGVVRCPLAGRKGNGVSYTLLQTRKSQKQRLQHNSASRAPLSLPRMGRSAPWCGAPGRATSAGPMVDGNGRSFG